MTKTEPRPPAADSRLQSGLSNFITQPKSQGAVAAGSSAVLAFSPILEKIENIEPLTTTGMTVAKPAPLEPEITTKLPELSSIQVVEVL